MSDPARKIRTTLTAITHLTVAAQTRLGPTLIQLVAQLEANDGYPTCASGSDTGHHSPYIPAGPNASTSSTERNALHPDERNDNNTYAIGARAALTELQDLLNSAVLALETVCRECDRRTPGLTDTDISRLRCATIPKGACTQWADPTRTDGYCIDHGRTIDTNRRRLTRHKAGAA